MNDADTTFAAFWKLAPARDGFKVGKQAARKRFDQLEEAEWPLLLAAVKKYRQYIEQTHGSAKDPCRFLHNRDDGDFWREWAPEQIPAKDTAVGAVIHNLADAKRMGGR